MCGWAVPGRCPGAARRCRGPPSRRLRVDITTDALPGPVTETLLEAGATSVVLAVGARGRGGFAGLRLGYTSLRTALSARGPVVVVRGPEHHRTGRTDRVVVGVSGRKASTAAADFALRGALRHGRLTAVHAWHPERIPATITDGWSHDTRPTEAAYAHKVIESAFSGTAAPAGDVPVDAQPSRVASLRASADADLLVLGARRGRDDGYGFPPGPTVHAMLHHVDVQWRSFPTP